MNDKADRIMRLERLMSLNFSSAQRTRDDALAIISSQASEIERLNADAGRYRFLRNNMSRTRPWIWDIGFSSSDQSDNLDDTIDAALRGDTP